MLRLTSRGPGFYVFTHAEESHNFSETASRRVTLILIGLGIATLIFGAWSFFVIEPGCKESVWSRLYRVGALFEFSEINLNIDKCYPYWQIEVARFTGPAATIVARALG